ncbi:MAG: hypothetical protein HYV34_03650 [Candidatus Kerfeldbacteria bacterium]|nr:hypothetical protein [Candidatus Kerfeldbacteria bacterium]
MSDLSSSLLSTLAYFDQFAYPLTSLECWRFGIGVPAQATVGDVARALDDLAARGVAESVDGFFVLRGAVAHVDIRRVRTRMAERKYAKAVALARVLRFFPYVRMIGVCNTLALSHSRPNADIDFFIVAERGHIWAVRWWTTIFAMLRGERPSHGHRQDTMCLSFYVTDDALDVQHVALDTEDVYLAQWTAQMVPVFETDGVYTRFWQENRWISRILPHAFPRFPARRRFLPDTPLTRLIRGVAEGVHWLIGSDLERLFRWIQCRYLPERLRVMANRDSRVMVTDSILKFHETDRREEYRQTWRRNLAILEEHSSVILRQQAEGSRDPSRSLH